MLIRTPDQHFFYFMTIEEEELYDKQIQELNSEETYNKVNSELEQVRNFYNKYFNGARYKKLLNKYLKNNNLELDDRYFEPDDVKLYKRLSTGGSNANPGRINFGLRDLIQGTYKPGEQAWDIGTILSHEFDHATNIAFYFKNSNNKIIGGNNTSNSKSRPDLLDQSMNYYDLYPDLYTKHSEWKKYYDESDDETKKQLDTNPTYGLNYTKQHDLWGLENGADLSALKYAADKYGLIDLTDPDYVVTVEDIQKLKEVMPKGFRMFNYYSDEDIANFFNTVAYNDYQNNQNISYAKQGRKLIPKKRYII